MKSWGLFLGSFLFLFSSLNAQKQILIVRNGIGNIEFFKHIAQKNNCDFEIIDCDLQQFKGIKKDRSLKGKILEKFTPAIRIDPKIEKFIFMNIPSGANKKLHLQKLPRKKMVLFMWEPPIRLRKMYSDRMQNCFSRIYTWNDDLVDNKTYFKFFYPNKQSMQKNIPSFQEKKFCTLIAGATTDKSRRHPNELYSERIKAIRFFERNEEEFEFYGKNWNATEYPSYRGMITDKIAVNKNYKFTICYENCNLPGYITEKIFDCFAAGSVPIYWGAPNVEEYIPKNCFIDRRDFSSLDELYTFLKNITSEEYEGYLKKIRTYLDSEKAQVFSPEYFKEILIDAIIYTFRFKNWNFGQEALKFSICDELQCS